MIYIIIKSCNNQVESKFQNFFFYLLKLSAMEEFILILQISAILIKPLNCLTRVPCLMLMVNFGLSAVNTESTH